MVSSHRRPTKGSAIRTFLIADIRGYTRFTARQGDEAASRLAIKFAEIATEGIEAWDGDLVELRGDEALAVFDSARQALRAAVELQSAFQDETAAEPALPLEVGIGLDAGEAVPVGDGYRGAALNLAARLCAVAAAGEVIASDGLVRLAGPLEQLDYEPLRATTLKGLDEPVAAVRVKGPEGTSSARAAQPPRPVSGPPPPLPAELDPIVPLAGREADLRWLNWHWRRARHGHGRVLVLSGPPGIGKTRLSAELATRAHELGGTVMYSPAFRAVDASGVDELMALDRPGLVIVDDLDAAPATMTPEIERLARKVSGRATLILVSHRREAPAPFMALVDRLAPAEQRRTLGPLEPDAIRAIAALYAGRTIDDLTLDDLVARSDGVPAAVHRMASQWARATASHRLETSAGRTSADRRRLRAAEAELIHDVTDLESVRERTRIYTLEGADEEDRAQARTICPYKGLAAFESADADYYFGRERLIAELIARFVGSSFLCLVGDSGSGKSSALLAGLLPALGGGVLPGSDTWPRAVLRPGEHPLAELGRSLASALPRATLPADDPPSALDAALATLAAGQRLVVVVDQFEEVFNATRDDAERSVFIDLLTCERQDLKVVVAIRADHYGRCAAYPALARAVGADHVLVGPLNPVELAAVVEHPAQRVGLRVEPELTEALVADAGTEPGMLPLLSTALLELWQARVNGRLTLAAYRASGGLQGAIARMAETAFSELDPYRQTIGRSILLRLAGPGEGSELVRRRVPVAEFDADRDPAVAEVLETLTRERLLTTGEGFVEVAHEALLREWPRLQGWLEEDAAGRTLRLHLIGAVRDWDQRGREPGDLYRGARLAAALEWAAEHQVELNAAERDFLDTGRQASEREAERQRRTNRNLRALLVGTAVLLLIALGAGGLAAVQGQRAAQESLNARSRELIASALAAREEDASLSKLLALEALSSGQTATAQSTSVLHQVLAADPIIARYSWPDDQPDQVLWTDLDPTGRLVLASSFPQNPAGHLEVADPRTGAVLWSFQIGDDGTASGGGVLGRAWFSLDGTKVIAGVHWEDPKIPPPSQGLGVRIWDATTGEVADPIDLGPCGGDVVAISETRLLVWVPSPGPDGQTGCHWPDRPSTVEVVDLVTGVATPLSDRAWSDGDGGTLSRDGRFAAFEESEGTVVVEVATGKRVFELASPPDGYSGSGYARQLNEDGTLLLYGDRPTLVYEVALGSSATPLELAGLGGGSWGGAFDPAGSSWYQVSTESGALRRWDLRNGQVLATWPAVGDGRPSIAADGRTILVSDPSSASAVLLDTGARGDLGQVQTCPPGHTGAGSLTVSDGLAAFGQQCADGNEVVQVVDLEQRTLLASLSGWFAQDVASSPDGRSFVSQEIRGGELGALKVADVRSGSSIVELEGLCRGQPDIPPDQEPVCETFPETPFDFVVVNVHWSPDGTMIAAVDWGPDSDAGHLAVWDARDGRLLFPGPTDPVLNAWDVVFSPDSERLFVTHQDTGLVEALATGSWTSLPQRTELDASVGGVAKLGFVGVTPDGSTILAVGGAWASVFEPSLVWLDADTLQVEKTIEDAFPGSAKSMALSMDGSLMAIGSSDGILRVWDARSGELDQQMEIGSQVQGVAFIDDRHLAVAPQTGDLLIMTLDPQELADIARASLTRGFTDTECKTYAIEPCPTLEEMQTP